MKFNYKNIDFELCEMVEPYENKTFDILAIFRVKYVIIDKHFNKIEVSKNDDFEFEDYEYINYFCNQGNILENLEIAKKYIDDYLQESKK